MEEWKTACAAVLLMGVCLTLSACVPTREAGKREVPTSASQRTIGPGPVRGFRVQVHLTPEKPEADAYVEDVLSWWQGVPAGRRPNVLPASDLPVEVAWLQPYYRVRVGAFTARRDAETALVLIRERFPDALIVPSVLAGWEQASRGKEERKKEREEEGRPEKKRTGGW